MTFPDASTREDRIDELERRVRRLEEALLESREEELSEPSSEGAVSARVPVPRAAEGPAPGSFVLELLAQTGWSVLALAGAFLVRALTDRGTMATAPGVALGLAYALAVFVLADRGAARGNRLTAAFLGSTGAFIANAIVAETTTRFAIFEPAAGLGVLAAATAAAVALGRRDDIPAVAWTGTLAACATSVYLAVKLDVPALSGILLLLLATATFALRAERWSWRLLPWPPTFAAVALSLWATSESLGGRAAGAASFWLALGIAVLWPASVLARTFLRRPRVDSLAVTQMVFALSAGFGGAILLARAAGRDTPLAVAAIASGLGAWALGFLRTPGGEPGTEARRTRVYFAWLGLALLLIGTAVILPPLALALVWSALALSGAAIAFRYEPAIFQAQAAVVAAAAAAASGLFAISLVALTASDAGMRAETFPALAALAAVGAAAVLLLVERPAAGPLPALAATLVAVIGIGGLAVILLRGPAGALLASPLPALRTVVVSVSAFALARLWRATGRTELRTLAYVALVAGGLKILIEDVPAGRPLTLFVAFVFYGGALLLVPRTMRATPTRSPAAVL